MSEPILNLGTDAGVERAFVQRGSDPVILPTYASPADFAAQYPTPLDTTEIIAMCEEITLWKALPEQRTGLKQEIWRELTTLNFTSGSSYIAFADGYCPEEYTHNGSNLTVTLKNIGAKKNLGISDIMHSQAIAAANWNGINQLVSPQASGEGVPGGDPLGTFQRETVRNVKEKEARLAMTLVMNGWDRLLVAGDTNANSLEFDGIEKWATNMSCTMHTNINTASGTFSAADFDRFLSEACAKPTHIVGHPQGIQEVLSSYFQLGFAGSQVVNFTDGGRVTPGFNFAGFVNTGVGRLTVIADNNFRRTAAGATTIQMDIWALRFSHDGEPLIYKATQIPLSMSDLTPGCTAISFQIWAKTALIIKACCAQSKYTSQFTGRITTTCTTIG